MSHSIHNSSAFVVGVELASENSSYVRFWTRERGLLGAWCQGVRQMRSKLRHHTTLLSHLEISLVQGRHMWRLTGADTRNYEQLQGARILSMVHRLSATAWRIMPREEADPVLFDFFRDSFLGASRAQFQKEALEGLEISLMLELLDRAGYLKDDFSAYRNLSLQESHGLLRVHAERLKLLPAINEALLATQL